MLVINVLSIQGEGFDVMKSGDARVALVGFPSVGKVSIYPVVTCMIDLWTWYATCIILEQSESVFKCTKKNGPTISATVQLFLSLL